MRVQWLFLSAVLFISIPAMGAEGSPSNEREQMLKSLSKDLGPPGTIELKTLELRARIYEPQVIYILDRARIDVDLKEQPIQLAPRVEEPVIENQL